MHHSYTGNTLGMDMHSLSFQIIFQITEVTWIAYNATTTYIPDITCLLALRTPDESLDTNQRELHFVANFTTHLIKIAKDMYTIYDTVIKSILSLYELASQ